MRELVCHGHAVKAVDVTAVTHCIVRVGKSVVHCLLLKLHVCLVDHLLLLCKFILEYLRIFGGILLDLGLRLNVEVILDWVLLHEMLVSFRQLPALINDHLDFVKVCPEIL
jgi:hypothetical protein